MGLNTKNVTYKYGINRKDFEKYLKESGEKYTVTMSGLLVEEDVEGVIERYKK